MRRRKEYGYGYQPAQRWTPKDSARRSGSAMGGNGDYEEEEEEEEYEAPAASRGTACERLQFDDADTAFILGKNGKTKQKIARVSGAKVELHERNNTVEITGTKEEVKKAKKYIALIQAQRIGPVCVDVKTDDDDDLITIDVPSDCVGFVTGTQGNFLRSCEEEWGTLMFFCDYRGPNMESKTSEQLAIFGNLRARAGAELKVMAAIEAKRPGWYTKDLGDTTSTDPEGVGMDTLPLTGEELSFALGKEGATRKKLARASDCILEYVGHVAYMFGSAEQRKRARDYITWLLQQRVGSVFIDITGRDDATAIDVPTELTGILKGTTLRDIEWETDTFCFLEGDVDSSNKLLIFGKPKGRKQAERKVRDLIRVRPRHPAQEVGGDRYKNENTTQISVRISTMVAASIDPKRLVAIQTATGTKITQNGEESVLVQGADPQVGQARKALHEYIYNLKVEDEFFVPKDVPFHAFIAKGGDGTPSILETVRNQTRVRVRVVQPEKKIVFGGIFSAVANARRDLQAWLGSFVTQRIHVEKKHLEKLSVVCKERFPKMKDFRHLCEAQIDKEKKCVTLSGAPDAVNEARETVLKFFKEQGWEEPKYELFSWKHAAPRPGMSSSQAAAIAANSAEGGRGFRRGGSRDEDGEPGGSRQVAELMQLTTDESAFILGKGGKTKHKIAKVSGAQLELHEHNNTIEIVGTDAERHRARKYIDLVKAQRIGPVNVDERHDDGDLTILIVPNTCVGFVTGTQGNFLRACEEEWGTLMFFCDYHGPTGEGGAAEKLAIFGGIRGRTGAELKVMAAIETKLPGHFTKSLPDEQTCETEWGRDSISLTNEELSFALGKDGSTRKKLAKASGCILEYVGNTAFMAGPTATRRRGREYLGWLLRQRVGTVYVDIEGRDDVCAVDIPGGMDAVASVFKSMTLRTLEQETGTFCFLEGNASKSDRLLIFSHDKKGREKAKSLAEERINNKIQAQEDSYWGAQGWGDSWNGQGGSWDYEYGQGYQGQQGYQQGYQKGYQKHQGQHYHDESKAVDTSEVTDTFSLRGDISVHVVIQTGPDGQEPVIEEVERATGTKLTVMREKGTIHISGPADKVSLAKRQLQSFIDRFVTCRIQLPPPITAALANKVSHYIRPMPWVASAEVDEAKDTLKIQGHQDSVDQTFKVLREVYKDHGLELNDADIITTKKAEDHHHTHSSHFHQARIAGKPGSADIIRVSEEEAAFILGRGGKTKHKIARVSGAILELHERSNIVEIFGEEVERKKARKYIDLIRAQRVGPVNVDETHDDGDLTMIYVPQSCVGFVTGSQGNFLRTCEEEWGTLMFFCDFYSPDSHHGTKSNTKQERLAIFGELEGRYGAELKVMAAIETKMPGHFTGQLGDTHSTDEWGTDTIPLSTDQLSYALGKRGSTRKKLARASRCIVEYVGSVAFLAGSLQARRRGREYLGWLCDQVCSKSGRISVDAETRNDVTLVPVRKDCIGYVMGDKRKTLSRLEEDWSVLIFFVDVPEYPPDVEGLAIFGEERGRCGAELKVMGAVETKVPLYFTKDVADRHVRTEWGVDTQPLTNDELSFALGKDGATRRKLARASCCILEYVGNIAYMAGSFDERCRARDYLSWLLGQRHGPVTVKLEGRTDIIVVEIPPPMRGMVKAAMLRDVERETGTFCFFQGDHSTTSQLLVCGAEVEDRTHAQHLLQDYLVRGVSRPSKAQHAAPAPRSKKQQAKSWGRKGGYYGGKQRGAPETSEEESEKPQPRRRSPGGGVPPPRRRRQDYASSDSESASHSDSESDDSQSDDDEDRPQRRSRPPPRDPRSSRDANRPPPTTAGKPPPPRRQWASEGSGSGSDEEIVPYWQGGGSKI